MGEHRLETILVTDLVRSTELLARLGDDAADDVRRTHFTLIRDAIGAHGGVEVKSLGDGFIVAFPSAVDAVECGVSIQQAAADHNRRRGVEPLEIRIGVAVGEVTIEDDGDRIGPPVAEAQRVCDRADGSQILVTDVVRHLASTRGTHEFVPSDDGIAELRWAPARTTAVPLPASLPAAHPVDFVGRAEERALLAAEWKAAAAGERRLALLAGEPGVGKTRLATEVAVDAFNHGAVVLFGRCDEDGGISYQPFAEALGHYTDGLSDDALRDELGQMATELVPLIPRLAYRVGGATDRSADVDPETARYRLFQVVSSALSTISENAPVVLVLDDLHWADRATLLLLRYLARAPEDMSVLIIGTYRDSDLTTDHPLTALLADLHRGRSAQRIAVRGLSDQEVIDLVERTAGHDLDEEGTSFAHMVRRETDGNPFFVQEILLHLVEAGAIEFVDGRWRATGDVQELVIPESVRDVVGRRVRRLSDDAHRILSLASVIGREFELPILSQVSERSDDQVLDALDEAMQAALIGEVADRVGRFMFSHALVRHALYSEMAAARRVRLHARVAEAIEDVYGMTSPDHVVELAHHWFAATPLSAPSEAGLIKATDASVRAAENATAALAHEQAVDHYRRALQVVELSADRAREGELLIALGEAQRRAGDGQFRETLLAAAAVAAELGRVDLLARAGLANNRGLWSLIGNKDDERIAVLEQAVAAVGDDDPTLRARLLTRLASELVFSDRGGDRFRLSDDALALVRTTSDRRALADVLLGRIVATWVPSTVQQRIDDAAELAAVAEALGDEERRGFAAFMAYTASMEAGDIPACDRALASLVAVAAERANPLLSWFALMMQGGRAMLRGDLEIAEQYARDALALGQRTGQPDAINLFAVQFFYVRYEQDRLEDLLDLVEFGPPHGAWLGSKAITYSRCGRLDDAAQILRDLAANEFRDIPYDVAWNGAIACFAETNTLLDEPVGAQQIYDLLLPFRDNLMSYGIACTGSMEYYLGLSAMSLGQRELAAEHFAIALEVNERIGAPLCVARVQAAQAELA